MADNNNMNSLTTIGAYLKDLRLRKGYSLERLSQETKINLNILKKIENDDLKNLPNITYVRGYVQNWVKTLHAPYDQEVLALINSTYQSKGQPQDMTDKSPATQTTQAESTSASETVALKSNKVAIYNLESLASKKVFLGILVIVVIILSIKFISQVNKQGPTRTSTNITDSNSKANANFTPEAATLGQLTSTSPPSSTTTAVATAAIATVTPTAVTTAAPTPIPTTKTAATLTPTPTPVPTLVGGKLPYVEFKKIRNIAISPDPSAAENSDKTLYPDEERKKVVYGKENVYLTSVSGDAWVSFKRDDEAPRSVLIKKNERLVLSANKLYLNVGNTDTIRIFHNGIFVKFTGNKGVKSFIFPVIDATQHSLPLFARDPNGKTYFYKEYMELMTQEPNDSSATSTPTLKKVE